MRNLRETNTNIVNQLLDLLQNISPEVYSQPLETLHGSSIGQHVRHIIEFYQCLQKGVETSVVNYDARERNLLIEQNIGFSINSLEETLSFFTQHYINTKLTLETAFGAEVAAEVPTCFERELVYLVEHSIHHMAIIKIGLSQSYPQIPIPANFGVAPSTIQHRQMILNP